MPIGAEGFGSNSGRGDEFKLFLEVKTGTYRPLVSAPKYTVPDIFLALPLNIKLS